MLALTGVFFAAEACRAFGCRAALPVAAALVGWLSWQAPCCWGYPSLPPVMLEMPSCTAAACPWASQPERLSTDVLKAAVQASIAAAFGLSRGDLPLHRRLQVALVLAVAAGSLSSAF